jgi:hypothetical protein
MIDLLSTAQILLRDADFTTRLDSLDQKNLVCFEDDTLVGFCYEFKDPQSLLAEWKARESSILTRFASSFRSAGDKAWNVYCAFLCESPADPVQTREVHWIEENLERTRKIAACGIGTRDELVRVLLPLLPIQYQPKLRAEDVTERLERRIVAIAPKAAHVALDETVSPVEVIRLLGDTP